MVEVPVSAAGDRPTLTASGSRELSAASLRWWSAAKVFADLSKFPTFRKLSQAISGLLPAASTAVRVAASSTLPALSQHSVEGPLVETSANPDESCATPEAVCPEPEASLTTPTEKPEAISGALEALSLLPAACDDDHSYGGHVGSVVMSDPTTDGQHDPEPAEQLQVPVDLTTPTEPQANPPVPTAAAAAVDQGKGPVGLTTPTEHCESAVTFTVKPDGIMDADFRHESHVLIGFIGSQLNCARGACVRHPKLTRQLHQQFKGTRKLANEARAGTATVTRAADVWIAQLCIGHFSTPGTSSPNGQLDISAVAVAAAFKSLSIQLATSPNVNTVVVPSWRSHFDDKGWALITA
jgi:hypothetical protein